MPDHEVWILGATGRTGAAVARRLHDAAVPLVLVGRDHARVDAAVAELDGAPRAVVGTLEAALSQLAEEPPGVVVNTVGPFTATAGPVTAALPPGTHYVDVSNELGAVQTVLDLDAQAVAAGQVLVAAAGFGVLATESVVLRLCADRPPPRRVRVDALASVATEGGVVGAALAGTIAEIAAFGGREVRDGQLVRARTAAHFLRLTTPDGDVLGSASGATGDLIAAWRASRADTVIAASTAAPANAVLRAILPVLSVLFRLPGVGPFATGRIARIPLGVQARKRTSSWTRARVEWSSRELRDGWLRTGDGMDFTAAAVAEVTRRLLRGDGRPGAYTPGALFGPELAEAAGGEFVLDTS